MIAPLVMLLWWLHYTKKGRSLLFYFQKWCNPWKYKVFNKKRSVRLDTTRNKVVSSDLWKPMAGEPGVNEPCKLQIYLETGSVRHPWRHTKTMLWTSYRRRRTQEQIRFHRLRHSMIALFWRAIKGRSLRDGCIFTSGSESKNRFNRQPAVPSAGGWSADRAE